MDRAHGDEDTVVESLNHTEKEKKKKKNPTMFCQHLPPLDQHDLD